MKAKLAFISAHVSTYSTEGSGNANGRRPLTGHHYFSVERSTGRFVCAKGKHETTHGTGACESHNDQHALHLKTLSESDTCC
jgi:hypothetical protein